MSSIDLIYNEETGVWEAKKEPYTMIEVASKEDFEHLKTAIAFYDKLVRCRDCVYYNARTNVCGMHSSEEDPDDDSGFFNRMDSDDFCSYGLRRPDHG